MTTLLKPDPGKARSETVWHFSLLASTAVNCLFQIAWFWRFGVHQISLDGINYVGVARHLVDGDFKASLHGYWSPLISWLIAAASVLTGNLELAGRVITVSSFLLCLPLLYLLTLRLWHSRVAAALAVLWFSTGRGIIASAACWILADFLLTACVLLYFVLLLAALRHNRPIGWMLLGAVHALAFLAKAIAMPWLSISSLLALLARNIRAPRRLIASFFLAFLLPVVVWTSWGETLRTKYGVFTPGCQLRLNLLINWHRWLSHGPPGYSPEFVDMSPLVDKYVVSIVPWSSLQTFDLRSVKLLPMIMDSELHNLPSAVKETVILLSPGGALGLAVILVLLARNRRQFQAEAEFAWITLLSVLSLIVAYCMLVFDGRYAIPIVPVLIAISCPAVLPILGVEAPGVASWAQKALLVMLVISTAFFAVYWASPFRTVDRDFARSCYDAAMTLKGQKSGGTLISIGNGPYPDRGVGFEAGAYVAYMAGWRLIGQNSALPDSSALADQLIRQVLASRSDAIAVWGSHGKIYNHVVEDIQQVPASTSGKKLIDPYKGEVGTLILLRQPEARLGLNP